MKAFQLIWCKSKGQQVQQGGNNKTNLQERKLFCRWWPQTIAPPIWFFSFLLVPVTAGSTWWCIQGIAQVVQLLQEGTPIHTTTRSNFKHSVDEIPADGRLYEHTWTGCRKASTQQQDQEECYQSPTGWPPVGYLCVYFWPDCPKKAYVMCSPWFMLPSWTDWDHWCVLTLFYTLIYYCFMFKKTKNSFKCRFWLNESMLCHICPGCESVEPWKSICVVPDFRFSFKFHIYCHS